MNRAVNLTKRVNTTRGWRYCIAVKSSNGRIKPDIVLVDGQPERHPEGAYYLEWHQGTRRVRLSVGKNATDAGNALIRKRAELYAVNAGVSVKPSEKEHPADSLALAIIEYLDEIRLSKKPKTYAAYGTALAYFQESCHKANVADIDRRDLLKFAAFLREKGQSPRSVYNKFENVMTFLKHRGRRDVVQKNDWPRYVQEEPEAYEKKEIDALLAVSTPQEKLWWHFFLMTGMREQEVMHCTWDDVNYTRSTVTVRYKAEYGFSPKNYKEREIPIPARLTEALKKAHGAANGCALLFPTAGCRPKLDFLDCLKACVKRGDLKGNFYLHKFRSTFATWALWAGVDFRTVQMWLGHSDIESTMRYLKPSRSAETRARVESIFA